MRVRAVVVALALCGGVGAGSQAMATSARSVDGWKLEKAFGARTWDGADAAVAVGEDDVWVFRSWARDFEVWVPSAYHWDGAKWSRVSLPKGLKGQVNGAAARSSSDVWATVSGDVETAGDAAVLHWDGKRWKVSKKVRDAVGLEDVTLVGKRGVMAVDRYSGSAFVWKYDGRTWSKKKSREVWQLSGSSPWNVWSVGQHEDVYRYVKGVWQRQKLGKAVPAHKPCRGAHPCADVVWNGIVPASQTRTWAFGYLNSEKTAAADPVESGLVLRRDAKAWKPMPVPRNWIPEHAATDGKGGLWLSGRQLDMPFKEYDTYYRVTWHVSAEGQWRRLPSTLTTSDGPGVLVDMARIPGTRRIIGVGEILLPGHQDSDDAPLKAAIWSLSPR